jgi:hypothetical protein
MKQYLLILICICIGVPSFAQLYPVNLQSKVDAASLIIEGKVTQQHSFWNQKHTMIFTANTIEIYKTFKGNTTTSTIELLTQGGSVGTDFVAATDLLTLEVGEIGVFFCFENSINLKNPTTSNLLYDVAASAQGALKYDYKLETAAAPFARYSSITQDLYPQLTKLIGTNYKIVKPFTVNTFNPPTPAALAITTFTPSTVWAGVINRTAENELTINGTDFGAVPSGQCAVLFDDPNDGAGGNFIVTPFNSEYIVSWTDLQIRVKVPPRAGTGRVIVRDAAGATVQSAADLNVLFSFSNLTFTGGMGGVPAPLNRLFNLVNLNGSGGVDFVYSTNTANGGVDFSTSPSAAPFDRAIKRMRETLGANYVNAGTTTTQTIAAGTAPNIVMFDNTATGVPVVPMGVLAICYTSGTTCVASSIHSRSLGFDILVRNNGVSIGATAFNNGPCRTATATTEYDMETVMLHELGHSIGLGHINDDYIGVWPNVDPGKVMNYAIVNGVDRRSADYALLTGGLYATTPRGHNYAPCSATPLEMTQAARIVEAKDNCPVFPTAFTPRTISIPFDLEAATSNKLTDPQYTRATTSGAGVGLTNNAFYAIRAQYSGSIILATTGYSTVPVTQQSCAGAGVEFSVYKVNTCPSGQAYPVPISYNTVNGNAGVTTILGVLPNDYYLVMADGISNTSAKFNLSLTGSSLPIRIVNFTGSKIGVANKLIWSIESDRHVNKIELEHSNNGINFTELYNASVSNAPFENGFYTDIQASTAKFYRLKITDIFGAFSYSNIVQLAPTDVVPAGGVRVFPNPTKNSISILFNNNISTTATVQILNTTGAVLQTTSWPTFVGNNQLTLPTKYLPSGVYFLRVTNSNAVVSTKFVKE